MTQPLLTAEPRIPRHVLESDESSGNVGGGDQHRTDVGGVRGCARCGLGVLESAVALHERVWPTGLDAPAVGHAGVSDPSPSARSKRHTIDEYLQQIVGLGSSVRVDRKVRRRRWAIRGTACGNQHACESQES